MQIDVVTVKFYKGAHGYYFNPNGLELKLNDYVIVDTEKGKELAKVTKEIEKIDEGEMSEPLKMVLRLATQEEIDKAQENYQKGQALFPEVKKFIDEQKLDMKVISVECNYNYTRLTVNFTSDSRVDFRELVKKLADKYKLRIELRQIGPRDVTRLIGGLGVCGKECCCAQGLCVDDHVSIKMAKNQGLSLNPNNISGLCGKLLCCLAYENPYYAEMMKIMPKVNETVSTPDGEGKVIYNDFIKKSVSVKFVTENTSEIKNYSVDDIKFKRQ